MVEAPTSTRVNIGELAKQIKESEFETFSLTTGRLLPDNEMREIFENCRKEQLRDPRFAIKLLKDEIRVLPLVNGLRNAELRGQRRKLSSIPLDQDVLVHYAKSVGIKMRTDRLVTAVARLIERQEAE